LFNTFAVAKEAKMKWLPPEPCGALLEHFYHGCMRFDGLIKPFNAIIKLGRGHFLISL